MVPQLAVRLLQTAEFVQLHGHDTGAEPWLLSVEKRPKRAVLRLRLVQSRSAGRGKKGLAQTFGPQRCYACLLNWHIFHWMLCLSEHKEGRNGLPLWQKSDHQSPPQMGFSLVSYIYLYLVFRWIFDTLDWRFKYD